MAKTSLLFIDTSFFKALVDSSDEFHSKALRIWKKLDSDKPSFVITNYVLDESFTLIRVRCGLEKVSEFRNLLSSSVDELRVVRVTIKDEADAWGWFTKNWSGLSFTDCVSFSVMKRMDIKKVLTFDKHFQRAGFEIVS